MQTINILYGGEDTRTLQYLNARPVSVSGDENSTRLHFIFPEGYTDYEKSVFFDVVINEGSIDPGPAPWEEDIAHLTLVKQYNLQTVTLQIAVEDWEEITEDDKTVYQYTTIVVPQSGQGIQYAEPDAIISARGGVNLISITPVSGEEAYTCIFRTSVTPVTTLTVDIIIFGDEITGEDGMSVEDLISALMRDLNQRLIAAEQQIQGKTLIRKIPIIKRAEYPLDKNDNLLLPLELTKAGRGKTVPFKLIIKGTDYTETSLGLAIKFSRM